MYPVSEVERMRARCDWVRAGRTPEANIWRTPVNHGRTARARAAVPRAEYRVPLKKAAPGQFWPGKRALAGRGLGFRALPYHRQPARRQV